MWYTIYNTYKESVAIMDFWRFLVTAISLVIVSKFILDTVSVYIQCNSKNNKRYDDDSDDDSGDIS